MAKKDFSAMLNTSNEQKIEMNLKLENQRLKEKISELQKLQSNDLFSVKLSEINLRNNIRDDYDFEEIQELANDILCNGQLQPILITNDNYLLTGYRRYFAMKDLSEDYEILVYRLNKENSEIDETELKEIQVAENTQRRNIDNFQLCNLYNWYIEQEYSQKDLAEKFRKSKGIISVILGIKNLDPDLVRFFKEFQIYGVSYKKFVDTNSDQQQKYLDKKEIIGYRPLYNIAKLPLNEQKKAFLKTYGKRLSIHDLASEVFQGYIEEVNDDKVKTKYEKALKSIDSLKNLVDNIKENISENQYEDFNAASNYLLELEHIFIKNSEIIS